ncbi:IS701 family transposase [Actinopolymorpha pittospori]|nr:IS701 family transposase [Actinopolymorpha pittospori]
MRRVGSCFVRPETARTARDVVDGLLAGLPRANCWTLAEHAGHRSPDRIQYLLGRAVWDDAAVRSELAEYVAANLTDGVDPDRVVLVFDETGDQKKGSHTVGVQRQYSGTCGRIENCQVAVFATLASPRGHAFIDVGLYLPQSWTTDPGRLAEAGVPEDVEFQTKPQLALAMTDRALAAGILPGWVSADEAYGDNPRLRQAFEERHLNYVMAVSCDTQIPTPADTSTGTGTGRMRADEFAAQLPATDWHLASAGKGSKGERLYHWALTRLANLSRAGYRWLLVRRHPATGEQAYFLCHATTDVSLARLATVAGTRWRIEENIQVGKGCAALDEHQVRTWTSWHRWTTLAMLAHAFLAVQAGPDSHPDPSRAMVPLTCNEIRHLRATITHPSHPLTHTIRWSRFRRHHQHHARLCHYRRRNQDYELRL